MKATHLLLCSGIVLALSCHSQTPPDFIQKTEQLAQQATDMGIFSGSIGISKGGKMVYTKHFGFADWNSKRPFTESTLFDIGSFNKDYTKEMINGLVKEGRISLNDPLGKHLKLFGNENDDKITIGQLVEMRSGMGDYLMAPGFSKKEKRGNLTLQDRLNVIKQQPLHFEPGQGKKYSNSGYVVLGALIEKVTGKSYDQNLKERILQPLGLTQTFYLKKDITMRKERALGTEMNFKGEKKTVDDVWSDASPDGGIYATMNDLNTFMTAFYEGKLPSGTNYGKGPLAGGSNYWNTVVVPFEDGTLAVVMSNMGEVADELAMRIHAIGTGNKPAPLQKPKEAQLYADLKEKGINYIEQNLKNITNDFELPYDDRFLNFFGYRFMNGGDLEAALALLQLNNKLFPKVANTYDSLAEAWLKKGNKEKAKQLYEKALEIDPDLKNAKDMLQEIKRG